MEDMTKSNEILENLKFINNTRILTTNSGINICKDDMIEFKLNKEDRIASKKEELESHEEELRHYRMKELEKSR